MLQNFWASNLENQLTWLLLYISMLDQTSESEAFTKLNQEITEKGGVYRIII